MSERPEGWAEARLEDVISDGPTNGYSPKSGSDANGTKSLKLSATTTGRFLLNEKTIKPLYEDVDVSSKYWLTAGDLLLQRANSLDYLGVAAIFPGPDKSFVYPDLMMRVRGSESCHTSYLWRHLNSDSTRSYFRDNATGTAGNMPKINGKVVKATPIKLPPLNEQKRIVAKIDALTEKSREAREALAEVPRLERLAVGYFSSGWGPQLLGEHIEARDELAGEEWRSFPALSLSNSGDLSPRTEKKECLRISSRASISRATVGGLPENTVSAQPQSSESAFAEQTIVLGPVIVRHDGEPIEANWGENADA